MSIITQTTVNDLLLTSNVVDEVDINGLSTEMMNGISIRYDNRHILLDAGRHQTSVDCNDFIKDGMLSSAELCGTQLVLKFNADASKNAISVDLSSLEEGGELTSYLNLHTGGIVSGDVDVYQHNISVTDGNLVVGHSNIINTRGSPFGGCNFVGGISSIVYGRNAFAFGTGANALSDNAFAEGYQTSALGSDSHAEGMDTIAYGDHSHAEGELTYAFGIESHVEGGYTSAYGVCSHAEGSVTNAFGPMSHAEGVRTNAFGQGSHTEGSSTSAFGYYSHASGRQSITIGDYSFAHGYQTNALSDNAFAEGYQTSALGERSHAEGSKTAAYGYKSHAEGGGSVTSGDMTHAEGETTSALWRGGHSEGKSTTAYMYAHAEGSETLAGYDLCASNAVKQGDTASHAEGYQTSAIARFSHAEGYQTLAGIPNASTRPIITNDATFNGERDFRIDQAAHAEGYQTSALGKASHAAGVKANAKDDYSFVWSAISSTNKTSNGSGTFSIYPINGIDGVYINAHPLTSYIPSLDLVNSKIDRKKPNCTIDDVSLISYGDQCIAKGNQSIAIGTSAYALSAKSIAYGHTITASNNYIFAFGEKLSAAGKYSIVVGNELSSSYAYSQVFGKNARSTNQKQFVWSAGGSTQETYVPKSVGGSFNINPVNGLSGFYIGQDNFIQCVLSAVQSMNDVQKTALKTALEIV